MLKPLRDYIYVQPDELADKLLNSGVIIPEAAQKDEPKTGVVVAVGPGKEDQPMVLKEGDKILYGKFAGTKIEYQGKNILLMKETDVFSKI